MCLEGSFGSYSVWGANEFPGERVCLGILEVGRNYET